MSRSFPLALIIVVLVSVPFSTRLSAQSCEQELARQDAALRQFDADARREGIGFLIDDVRRTALDEVGKRLKGDATADAAREIKARWDEYQSYVDQGKTFQTVASELSRCLRSAQGGCLAQIKESVQRHTEATRLAARIGEAVQKWIDSLGNDAISRASERVDRASGILQNFTSRAGNAASVAATQGINSCLRDFDRRVQQAQNQVTPATTRTPPPVARQPTKGMSTGTLVAIVGGIGAAAGTAIYAKGVIADATGTGTGGDGGSSQVRLVNGNAAIQCSRVGGASLQSLCTGPIILDVGNVFSAGTQVCIRTDPSALADCQVKDSSSQIAFNINERIINLDFNSNITGCRPVQTGIFVYNGLPNNVPATVRVSANIPVTCN